MPLISKKTIFQEEQKDLKKICDDFLISTKTLAGISDADFTERIDTFFATPDLISESKALSKSYWLAKKIPLHKSTYLKCPLENAVNSTSAETKNVNKVTLDDVAALLKASYGLKENGKWIDKSTSDEPWPKRATASAGALFPLEIFPLVVGNIEGLPKGLYHFDAVTTCLEALPLAVPIKEVLQMLPANQDTSNIKIVFLITATFYKSSIKYGRRAYRFALLETGHVQTHLDLAARALGLVCTETHDVAFEEIEDLLFMDGVEEAILGVSIIS